MLFRSPGVFIGYYKDPEKTAEVKTADGWVHTGDAGFIDPKTGHLKIIDRAKDVGQASTTARCSRRNTSRTSSNSTPTSRKPWRSATGATSSA